MLGCPEPPDTFLIDRLKYQNELEVLKVFDTSPKELDLLLPFENHVV